MGKFTNALVLMRIPFSIFLMPVFWFSMLTVNYPSQNWPTLALIFFILHILVYPASNGYNSYFDKDEESIGGLEKPPKVAKELFYMVVLFDILSILLSASLGLKFTICILIYLLISKAYSWDKIRLKKFPIVSTLVVTFFQGGFVFYTVNVGVNPFFHFSSESLPLAICSTLFLMGSYPITQIYQHHEDQKRGDKTLSLLLGKTGTFIFSGFIFAIATAIMLFIFYMQNENKNIIIFLSSTAPILFFFTNWFIKSTKNHKHINYKNTMLMNKISSICLSLAFILMVLLS